ASPLPAAVAFITSRRTLTANRQRLVEASSSRCAAQRCDPLAAVIVRCRKHLASHAPQRLVRRLSRPDIRARAQTTLGLPARKPHWHRRAAQTPPPLQPAAHPRPPPLLHRRSWRLRSKSDRRRASRCPGASRAPRLARSTLRTTLDRLRRARPDRPTLRRE